MGSSFNRQEDRLMNTFTNKLRAGALGITLTTCVVTLPVYAAQNNSAPKQQSASKQENIGVATGFAVGAAAGGPIGAIVGAAAVR